MNKIDLRQQYEDTKVDGLIEPYHVIDSTAFHYLKKHNEDKKKNIIVFGYTYKSKHICKMLKEENIDITIYEIDHESYETAKSDGFSNVILIDPKSDAVPQIHNGIVMCAMNDEALNVYITITLRANGFPDEIVALSDTKEDNRKLLLAGVSRIFDMYEESASQFVEMIENNVKKGNF